MAKKFLKFCCLNIILHSKVDIISGKVNITYNDSLISIIHKGSKTLISNNKNRETPSLVNGALDCFLIEEPRGKVGAKHLLEMNIFV